MKFYKDENNQIFAYESDGSQDEFISENLIPITDDEKNAILNPPETAEQVVIRLEAAIDRYLDAQAQSLRYESIRTIVTYHDDINPQFKAEGIAGKTLRSACYTKGIELIGKVQAGEMAIPTEQELIDLMPKITDYLVYPAVE
jgi:hypothetical protein